jgi:hypothetical protein
MARLRAQFDGRVFVPLEPVDLPTGRVFHVEVTEAGEVNDGSPLRVLQASRTPPHVDPKDVDELEMAVASARR